MPQIKFTDTAIAKLKAPTPDGRPKLFWDATLAGFGIRLSGKTAARVYIVQRSVGTTAGGKRRITLGHVDALTLDEARTLAHAQIHAMRTGVDPRKERKRIALQNITLREAMAKYLNDRPDLSSTVRNGWPRFFTFYLLSWLDTPLRDIDGDMIEVKRQEIIAGVLRRARVQTAAMVTAPGTGVAGLTLRAFTVVRNHVAQDAGLPPLALRRRKSGGGRRNRVVGEANLAVFWQALGSEKLNQRDVHLIKLLLLTGLRIHEASSLQWNDLDFAERLINVRAEQTKPRRALRLPMTTQLFNLLMTRRALGRLGGYVFPAARLARNKSGHATDLGRAFKQIAATCGIRVSPHDLRRQYCSIAESCEVSMLALKQLVNHSTGQDVTVGYIRIELPRLRAAAQRIADRIEELCEVEPLPAGVATLL